MWKTRETFQTHNKGVIHCVLAELSSTFIDLSYHSKICQSFHKSTLGVSAYLAMFAFLLHSNQIVVSTATSKWVAGRPRVTPLRQRIKH